MVNCATEEELPIFGANVQGTGTKQGGTESPNQAAEAAAWKIRSAQILNYTGIF